MDQTELQLGLSLYREHVRNVCQIFNDWAEHRSIPVRLNADKAIAAVDAGVGLARVAPFWSRVDDTGVVHEAQLKTVLDCIVELRNDAKRCGHVLGAMQSGKTTTSLALQWAGPILYLLTGQRAYPFYLISSQTSHEDQTKVELGRFLAYYGNLEIIRVLQPGETAPEVDAMFALSPTLATYKEHVLRGALDDVLEVPALEDLVHRRVGGDQGIGKIVELCRRAKQQGYRPLMMIDEPQFGASDRIVPTEAGNKTFPCVLEQIFSRIEEAVGADRTDHWFIGLSATPFELNDLTRVWEVRQYLTSAYSGFNFFNQKPIDGEVDVTPPTTMGMTQFATLVEIPFVSAISMSAYGGSTAVFERHAKKIEYTGDQAQYQLDVERTLRQAVMKMMEKYHDDPAWPVGLCIRAFNDNARTGALIGRLGLDPSQVEVIEYYGPQAVGLSVKRAIARRQRQDLPFVIFVTNRARMADAFPVGVRFFMDLAQKASDLNALLQGLLGRACGYNKCSTVVLSDANSNIVDAYRNTEGGYVHRTSRHSVPVGGFRRGAPTNMIKLRDEMTDPIVQEFFRRINSEIVAPNMVSDGKADGGRLRVRRARHLGASVKFRTAPILRIATETGLFEHIESPDVREKLFPQIKVAFHVVRGNEKIKHHKHRGVELGYALNADGDCRYTFRLSSRSAAAQGGAAGRAKGLRDTGQHIEPTIYLEKRESGAGAKPTASDGSPAGAFNAFMVTFPLRDAVREITPATVAYPVEHGPYNDWMEPEQQEARDKALVRKVPEKVD